MEVMEPMDAIDGTVENVGCNIEWGMGQDGCRCTAASIDELKNQALQHYHKRVDSAEWKEAKLVCRDDGSEVLDMTVLKKHLEKGHENFCLIDPSMVPCERAINVDAVVDLCKELAGLSSVELEVRSMFQRDDLGVITHVHTGHLASKLSMSFTDAMMFQGDVFGALGETRKRLRLISNDPFSIDYGYDFENDEFH